MKVKNILTVVAIVASTVFSVKAQKEIVLVVNNDSTDLEEFTYVIHKNNDKAELSQIEVEEYLDLYVNFKLKVAEAYDLGYDTNATLVRELGGYKLQLQKPYLTDTSVTSKLVKEAYDHMLKEVHARHILVKVSENASPEDTLKAYNKIKKIRARAVKGEDFVVLAKETSEGPSAVNGGDLGYFTAFKMIYPFEVAAYNTNVGEVSSIVRTKYGYHILYVEDVRDAVGQVTVAQIFLSTKDAKTAQDSLMIKRRIDKIYAKVIDGENFGKIAKVYSGDYTSAKKGGVLRSFGRADVSSSMKVFADTCFALTEDGQISEPFLSPLGWHIVKRLKYEPLADFKSSEKSIENRVKKDPTRMQTTQDAFIGKLKKEYRFKVNKKEYKKLFKIVDTSIFSGNWVFNNEEVYTKTLVSFSDKTLSSNEFLNFLAKNQSANNIQSLSIYLDVKFNDFVNQELIRYERSVLEVKYPEYGYLINEYTEGILLFELVQDSIWKKAELDTAGLKRFFNENKENYTWGDRVDAAVYKVEKEDVANLIYSDLQDGKLKESIDKKYNTEELSYNYQDGKFEIESEGFLKGKSFNKGINGVYQYNDAYYIVVVNEFIDPSNKKFTEIKGIVISDYQKKLEEDWMKYLKNKYPVIINEEVLLKVK